MMEGFFKLRFVDGSRIYGWMVDLITSLYLSSFLRCDGLEKALVRGIFLSVG